MKNSIFFLCLLFVFQVDAQSNYQKFKKLSCQKKVWVLLHPFKAKRALKISNEAKKVSDSIINSNLLDGDYSGGQVDAFRHAYWMARLRQEIGKNSARSLGKAHEKENYQYYKSRKLEDGVLPDEPSMKMDLHNNEEGLKLTRRNVKTPKKGLIYRVINAIKAGKMQIIKKDKKGNFLTCDGKLISKDSLKGKWKNKKCLVPSNHVN